MSQLQTFSTRKCTSIDDVVHNSSQISKMGKKKVAGVSHTNAKKVAEKIAKHDELAALNDRLLAGWSGDPGLLDMSVLPPEIKKTQKETRRTNRTSFCDGFFYLCSGGKTDMLIIASSPCWSCDC